MNNGIPALGAEEDIAPIGVGRQRPTPTLIHTASPHTELLHHINTTIQLYHTKGMPPPRCAKVTALYPALRATKSAHTRPDKNRGTNHKPLHEE